MGLTVPKMEVVRVGFVGLGMRGPGAVERFTHIPGTQIVALCDYEQERAEACQKYLMEASLPKAAVYSGEKDMRSSANGKILILYISQPTGCIISCSEMCLGTWEKCSGRGPFRHESGRMLGADQFE